MPPVSWSTMPDLRAIILGTSILGVPTLMPWPSKAWPASSNRCEVQQRLGGNAADVQAGAAEARLALRVGVGIGFAAGGLEAELRGTDRGDVAAGAAADDEDVEFFWTLGLPVRVESQESV